MSQDPIASLKLEQLGLQPLIALAQKRYDRSLTRDTSQSSIGPNAVTPSVRFAHHVSRAVSSAARLVKLRIVSEVATEPMRSTSILYRARPAKRTVAFLIETNNK